MSLFKSSNPALSEKKFRDTVISTTFTQENSMTIKGTLNKFGFMLLMLMGSAFYSWKEFDASEGTSSSLMPMILGGVIGGFVIALIITFKREWSQYLAPLYALCQGLCLGALSAMFNTLYDGIVLQAIGLTFSVGIGMYFLYSYKIIKATEKFKSVIIAATVGIGIFYLITMVLSMFQVNVNANMPFINGGGMFGIGFSLLVVGYCGIEFDS